jgi:hypothetical protein
MVSRAAVVILLTVHPSRSWFATQAWEPVRKVQYYTLSPQVLRAGEP